MIWLNPNLFSEGSTKIFALSSIQNNFILVKLETHFVAFEFRAKSSKQESKLHVWKRALCHHSCFAHTFSLQKQASLPAGSNLLPWERSCFTLNAHRKGQKLWLSLKPAIFCHFVRMLWVAKSQLGSADTLLYSRTAMPAYICLGMNSSNRSPAKCAGQQRKSAWLTPSFWSARLRKGMNL